MKQVKKRWSKKIELLLYLLIANFVLLLLQIFLPPVQDVITGKLFLLPFISFSFLGFLLVYLTKKAKLKGKLSKQLSLTGYAAGLIFVGVMLHNLVSAAVTLWFGTELEEPVFFIVSTIILPILFVISAGRSLLNIRQMERG